MLSLPEIHSNITPVNSGFAAPSDASHLQQNPPLKRKFTQRVVFKGGPQAIQSQMNEIQRLNQELAQYKNQYHAMNGNQQQRDKGNRQRIRLSMQSVNTDTLKQVLLAGDEYRLQLMTAQDKKSQLSRQNNLFQRQLENISREKDSLLADIANERSKTSILQQELFMAKDSFLIYKNRSEGEKHELMNEIMVLRSSCSNFEAIVKQLTSKVNLLPLYEQRKVDNEYNMGLLSQQLMQVKGDLRYYQEKSNYFQTNYTVLNQNFNNLYNHNYGLSNQLNESKSNNLKLENSLRSLQDQCKRVNIKYMDLKQEKNKTVNQLNTQVNQLTLELKEVHQTLALNERNTDKLNYSLQNTTTRVAELEKRNQYIERELESKSHLVQMQKIANQQLLNNQKELENAYNKKEQFWKNALTIELSKVSHESNSKLLSISTQLIKSEENAKRIVSELHKNQQELKRAQQSIKEYMNDSLVLQQKEKVIISLISELEKAKINETNDRNTIMQYEKKLTMTLLLQQQTVQSNRISLEQKTAEIKQIELALNKSNAQVLQLQQTYNTLQEETAKITQIAKMQKTELQFKKELIKELQQKINEESSKTQWLNEQNSLKEKIISRYSQVTEQMRQKISSYYQEIEDLSERHTSIQREVLKLTLENKERGSQIVIQEGNIQEMNQKLQRYEVQTKQLQFAHILLEKTKTELLQEKESLTQNVLELTEKLNRSTSETKNLQTALKQTVHNLTSEKEMKVSELNTEYDQILSNLKAENEKLGSFSQEMFRDFKMTVETLRLEITELIELNREKNDQISLSKANLENLQHSLTLLKSQNKVKSEEIEALKMQILSLTKAIEDKTCNIEELKIAITKQIEISQNSIQKSNSLSAQCIIERQALNSKVNEVKALQEEKNELQRELNSYIVSSQNLKIYLEGERIRTQNLTLENDLLRKSLREMQTTLTSRFESEIATKSKLQGQEFERLTRDIERLNRDKEILREQTEKILRKLAQKDNEIMILSKENEKLEQIMKKNLQVSKAENDLLKRANIQLTVEYQRLIQTSQSESRSKNQLSNFASSLEARNVFLEEYHIRSQGELDSIQKIFYELKDERDLLVKKYIIITNEIYKLNPSDPNLSRELDSFAQYFSKISSLHSQINRHLYNISQVSQSKSIRSVSQVRQASRMEENIVNSIQK